MRTATSVLPIVKVSGPSWNCEISPESRPVYMQALHDELTEDSEGDKFNPKQLQDRVKVKEKQHRADKKRSKATISDTEEDVDKVRSPAKKKHKAAPAKAAKAGGAEDEGTKTTVPPKKRRQREEPEGPEDEGRSGAPPSKKKAKMKKDQKAEEATVERVKTKEKEAEEATGEKPVKTPQKPKAKKSAVPVASSSKPSTRHTTSRPPKAA